LRKLGQISSRSIQKEIIGDQYKLLSKWYHMVVRALVSLDDFRPDPKFLSRKLRGFVSPAEIEKSLELLVEIGL